MRGVTLLLQCAGAYIYDGEAAEAERAAGRGAESGAAPGFEGEQPAARVC